MLLLLLLLNWLWLWAPSAVKSMETIESYIDIKCHVTQMVNLLGLSEKKQHHQCEYVVCVNCRSRANQETNNWERVISNQFSLSKKASVLLEKKPTFKNRKHFSDW